MINQRKRLLGLVLLLGLLVFGSTAEGSQAVSPFQGASEDPLEFLRDFSLVAESVTLVEDRYIVAMYENSYEGLYVIVVFLADCTSERCSVIDIVAYLTNAPEEDEQEYVAQTDILSI